MFKEIQNLIGWWGDKTFPNSNASTVLSHLEEEIKELREAHDADADTDSEVADVFLLAMQYAHKTGVDILELAMRKMDVNMRREWNIDNPEPGGHVKHKTQGR